MAEETQLLLELVRRGAQEASLCTEPAMVALAAAKARSLINESPTRVEVTISPGVMKNCLDVGLPRTDRKGAGVAAALGAVSGGPGKGLQALREVDARSVVEAHRLLDSDGVEVSCSPDHNGVYCRARVLGATRTAEVTIEGHHSKIIDIRVDGRAVRGDSEFRRRDDEEDGSAGDGLRMESIKRLPYKRLLDIVISVEAEEVQYLVEGALSALSLADEALQGGGIPSPSGFTQALYAVIGHVSPIDRRGFNLAARARLGVAAAVCARMSGVVWPVLTSCGSGNQGIAVGIPVLLAARSVKAGPAEEARALLLAHATNLYMKAFAGTISALCGAVSAGAGVAASICWLMGGDGRQIEGAAQAVVGNLYGMICDGAKTNCALKCAAGVAEGILAAEMAINGAYPRSETGIVGRSLRDTAVAMGSLSAILSRVDSLIIGIRSGGDAE